MFKSSAADSRGGTRVAQSVENVPLQRAFRDARVIEIVFRRARHAKALHDTARALVGGNRQRDDLS
jgi:hypothetical protein